MLKCSNNTLRIIVCRLKGAILLGKNYNHNKLIMMEEIEISGNDLKKCKGVITKSYRSNGSGSGGGSGASCYNGRIISGGRNIAAMMLLMVIAVRDCKATALKGAF